MCLSNIISKKVLKEIATFLRKGDI